MSVKVSVGGKGFKRLAQAAKDIKNTSVKVGWFSSNKYPNGTPVAQAAVTHEFGLPEQNIPPRPFIRPAIKESQSVIKKIIEQGTKKALNGTGTAEQMMGLAGEKLKGQIQKSIQAVTAPPLKEETIKARIRRTAGYNKLLGNLAAQGASYEQVQTKVNKFINKKLEKSSKSLRKPLVDTGLMFDSVTYIVEKK